VLDLLTSLIDKSLVLAEERNEGTRYRTLETMHEYARERLNESRDGDAVRASHLAFYLAFAEEAGPSLVGPKQSEWLEQLDRERENLLSAHASCDHVENGAAMGMRLVHAVKRYWVSRGLLELGKRVTLEALARTSAQVRNLARCRALFAAGQFGCFMGQYGEARVHLEESSTIAREIGDESLLASITTTLALAALGQDDHVAARTYFEGAIILSRASGNKRELSVSLNGLGQLNRMEGALDEAEALYQQALGLMRELGDRESTAVMLLNLAIVSIGRGSGTQVREILQDVLAISIEMQSKPTGQCALDVCAGLAALRGEWKRAARFFGTVEAQTAQGGYHRDPADEAFLAPLITRARARLGTESFNDAETDGGALSYDDAVVEAGTWLRGLA
jgi:non-specific serine/threonine protein kinase